MRLLWSPGWSTLRDHRRCRRLVVFSSLPLVSQQQQLDDDDHTRSLSLLSRTYLHAPTHTLARSPPCLDSGERLMMMMRITTITRSRIRARMTTTTSDNNNSRSSRASSRAARPTTTMTTRTSASCVARRRSVPTSSRRTSLPFARASRPTIGEL